MEMVDEFLRSLGYSYAGYYLGIAVFALIFIAIPAGYERLPHVRRRKEHERQWREQRTQNWIRTGRWE